MPELDQYEQEYLAEDEDFVPMAYGDRRQVDDMLNERDEMERLNKSSRMDQLIGEGLGRQTTTDTGQFIYRSYINDDDGDEMNEDDNNQTEYKDEELNLEAFQVPLRLDFFLINFFHLIIVFIIVQRMDISRKNKARDKV